MRDAITTDVQNCYWPMGPYWEVPRWVPYTPATPFVPPQAIYITASDPRVEILTQEVAALRREIAELRAEQERQRRRYRRYGR